VADILGTFNEPEVSQIEAERLLDAVHAGLTAVKKLVVVVTLGSSNRYDEAVSNWSDTLVRLSPRHQGEKMVRAQLLRHPTKKKGDFSDFAMNQLLFHPDSPPVEELVR